VEWELFAVVSNDVVLEWTAEEHGMRPGLERWFEDETADLRDKKIPYVIRLRKRQQLIQAQEGVVKIYTDKSISPIDPVDEKDASEYLERLKQIVITL